MAEVRAFRALHYDPDRVAIADVTAPPYDVIEADGRSELLARSPQRRRARPARAPTTATATSTPPRLLASWRDEGIIVADPEPAIWAYEQDYTAPGGDRRTRRGFLARIAVTDYGPGLIRPHERTQPGPKEDRLRLTRATGYNLSPIFVLHAGDAWSRIAPALGGEPFCEVTDADGTVHRAWPIADPGVHDAVADAVAGSELLIADGHHRYETARAYADEVGAGAGDEPLHARLPGLARGPRAQRLRHPPARPRPRRRPARALRDTLMELFDLEAIDDPAELVPDAGDGTVAFGYMDSPTARLPAPAQGRRRRWRRRSRTPPRPTGPSTPPRSRR